MAQEMAVQGLIYQHARLRGDLIALQQREGKLQAVINEASCRPDAHL